MVKIKAFYISHQMKGDIKLTWKYVVKEALAEIGTSGHLDEIYSKIKRHPKTINKSKMERHCKTYLTAVQYFYQEGRRSVVSI